jgi:hypothetical protein
MTIATPSMQKAYSWRGKLLSRSLMKPAGHAPAYELTYGNLPLTAARHNAFGFSLTGTTCLHSAVTCYDMP